MTNEEPQLDAISEKAKKFQSKWELAYFLVSVVLLLILAAIIFSVVFGAAPVPVGILIAPVLIPWTLWSFWSPFLILRSWREFQSSRGHFRVVKLVVYTLSLVWLLAFFGLNFINELSLSLRESLPPSEYRQ